MKVKALKRHSYNRRIYKQGDEYHIENEKHVQIFCAVKCVRIVLESDPDVKLSEVKYTNNLINDKMMKTDKDKKKKRKEEYKHNYTSKVLPKKVI